MEDPKPAPKPPPKCVVCKTGDVVHDVEKIDPPFSMSLPVGEEDRYARHVVTFRCNNTECAIAYHHPPGDPKAEERILDDIRHAFEHRYD
ncbi:MAG TPA: hypothetical protein VFT82_02975 [Candidatus Paceibacterota bacterium]|nr:hypothetical protein [Candidatus Paceibacterota bacterium]